MCVKSNFSVEDCGFGRKRRFGPSEKGGGGKSRLKVEDLGFVEQT